jgi:hypothetical protein
MRQISKESNEMVDISSKGIRCRAAHDIPTYEGTIRSHTEGTIVYELVGYNGNLVNVYWDHGVDSLVDSDEIVITDLDIVWH